MSDTQLILTVQAMIESVYQNYLVGGDEGPNLQDVTPFCRNAFDRQEADSLMKRTYVVYIVYVVTPHSFYLPI